MAVSRKQLDELAEATFTALLNDIKQANAEGKRVHWSTISSAVKLFGKVVVADASAPPILEQEEPEPTRAEAQAAHDAKMRDLLKDKIHLIGDYLTDEERAHLAQDDDDAFDEDEDA